MFYVKHAFCALERHLIKTNLGILVANGLALWGLIMEDNYSAAFSSEDPLLWRKKTFIYSKIFFSFLGGFLKRTCNGKCLSFFFA